MLAFEDEPSFIFLKKVLCKWNCFRFLSDLYDLTFLPNVCKCIYAIAVSCLSVYTEGTVGLLSVSVLACTKLPYMPIHPSIHPCTLISSPSHPSTLIHPSISLSISPSMPIQAHTSFYPSMPIKAHPSIDPSVPMSIHLSIFAHTSPSINPSSHPCP